MRLADFIFKTLADHNYKDVFMITGGGGIHLFDAVSREARLKYFCNHHEQASSMAAEAYARVKNEMSILCVTTGPGGINALNGVFGAWTDSIPMLIISGQVKNQTYIRNYDVPGLRQLGDQEADIISMVKGITKYAETVTDPKTIKYHLDRALYLANSGRKGPVWLDIPIDVQATDINPDELESFDEPRLSIADAKNSVIADNEIYTRLINAKKPVVLAGSGIRLADAKCEFLDLLNILKIPVVTSWTGHDLIAFNHPCYCGRAGSLGDRSGNFAVQNSDLLIVIGSRLNIRQVSYNWENFAKNSFVIHVDIDSAELVKPTYQADIKVNLDAKDFILGMRKVLDSNNYNSKLHSDWLNWSKDKLDKYPVLQDRHTQSEIINPYNFIAKLFDHLDDDEIVACGDGTACVVTPQVAKIKSNQKVFTNSGCASMGYGLPAAIGSAVAFPGKRVVCLTGDGSIQMNLQELQTVIHHKLPIKIFLLNNQGYLSIKLTQKGFFTDKETGETNFVGSGLDSGLSFPDFYELAKVYGFKVFKLDTCDFEERLEEILNTGGPVFIEVILDPEQGFEPKLSARVHEDGSISSPSLEDMAPFLNKEEIQINMDFKINTLR